jgi:predicted dehydrogenase
MPEPISRRTLLKGMAAVPLTRLPRPVRVGIVGLVGHPAEISNPLDHLPDVEIVGIAGATDAEVARYTKGKQRLEKVKRYDDYRRMLDAEKLDVLAVCNDNGGRAAVVLEGLRRDLHIVAEKPLATRREDLDAIKKELRSRPRVKLTALLEMRFRDRMLAIREVMDTGEIGEVLQASGQKSYHLGKREPWYQSEATYGSTILWIGIHMIDLLRWLSGREFVEVASFMARVGLPEAKDQETTASSVFRMDNGGTATVHLDYCLPSKWPDARDDRIRLAGTNGILDLIGTTVTVASGNSAPRTIALPPPRSLFADFLDHVYNGKPTMLKQDDVIAACEITLAAHEAAKSHSIVRTGRG